MIYFLHAEHGGPIKIGSSILPVTRRNAIGNLFPYPVQIIAAVPGGKVGEAFLHLCMRPKLIGAEWFSACLAVWKLLVDAAEDRLGFLPPEGPLDPEEFQSEVIRLFGSLEIAKDRLGYAPRTSITQTFGRRVGSVVSAKVAFHRALIEGTLPTYIAELHADYPHRAAESAA